MARTSLFDAPRATLLQDILALIEEGDILFPDFQRPFVWKHEQRLSLFDSILRGIHIGSILLWRTDEDVRIKAEVGPVKLPARPDRPPGTLFNYVLDGLQRLTTLYAALTEGIGSADDEGEPDTVFIDLAGDLDDRDVQHFKLAREAREPTWLPLHLLFDDAKLYDFQDGLFGAGLRAEGNRVRHVARRFARFEIPVVAIVTSDLELVTQTFERVNTQGTQMGEAHMLRTLLYTTDLGLDARFDALIEAGAWPDLPRQLLVNIIKALLGQSVYRSDMRAIANAIRDQADGEPVLDRLHRGVLLAVDFLRDDCRVYSYDALPYAYQLAALTLVMLETPNPDRAALRRWFWVTTYAEYFTGQSDSQLRRSFDDAVRVGRGEAPTILSTLEGDDLLALPRRERPKDLNWPPGPTESFRAGTVRSTAWLYRLADRPLVDLSGHPLDGHALLGRGTEVALQLYPGQDSRRPGNRLLAAPETARELRAALHEPAHPHVAALRAGHGLPPLDHAASATPEATLTWREQALQGAEQAFIKGL